MRAASASVALALSLINSTHAVPLLQILISSRFWLSPRLAYAVLESTCLRCGLNDESSPGLCCFHPGLLPDPGPLRHTPEYVTVVHDS
eukprot:1159185-Pelagomonas_calceolata.AAC.8